jgi:uncharacterized protein (TIGR03067 family)
MRGKKAGLAMSLTLAAAMAALPAGRLRADHQGPGETVRWKYIMVSPGRWSMVLVKQPVSAAASRAQAGQLQGTWSRLHAEVAGKQVRGADTSATLTFTGTKWLRKSGEVTEFEGTYRTDGPKLDLNFPGGRTSEALFRINGDVLRLAATGGLAIYPVPAFPPCKASVRPTDFRTKPGDFGYSEVWLRVTPERKAALGQDVRPQEQGLGQLQGVWKLRGAVGGIGKYTEAKTLTIDGTRWSWCGVSGTLKGIITEGNVVRAEMVATDRPGAGKVTFRREGNTLYYCPTCQLTGAAPASAPSLRFVRAATKPAGLLARWSGEGNAKDSAGNHHGTIHGGVTFAPGKVGRAFKMDGVHSYIDVGGGFDLEAMTLDAWVFIDPATNTDDRRVISKDNVGLGGVRKEFSLKSSTVVWSGHDGRPGFEVLIGNDVSAIDVVTAPFALSAGWHHLAGVRDPSAGRFELYVDGMLVASKKPTGVGAVDSSANVYLGSVGPNFAGEHFAGLIDEAEIFGRALSGAEVRRIYAAGAAGKPKGRIEAGCFIEVYSSDPNIRINHLIDQAEDMRQIEAEWRRFWFADQPRHLRIERVHGGIQ